ncbi:hypothetical protein Sinac_0627 [Singulisphaera acidiphila DSM 18658]|uniref:Uncharacterized protein n=1 Tax=Singulisphaera acidiphila (strain ATCC BAA-1392 / DSM 18658 / VKM B-2454 / MOB10) TaxID=886293 RepID=L0D726_SINAD|nr:hypothetical protein Sinac_0627 [Singulisphaera acidiphila DSM 18658]
MVVPVHNLEDAIGRLYDSFSTVPKPHCIDGCPCCIDRKSVGTLLEKRLRCLTPDDLSSYASSAFLTVGEAADYLYFLPRILDITAREPSWWPRSEVTGRAIRAARPDAWTAGQRAALNDYLGAVVDAAIESGDYDRLDGWICAVASMGFDVRPLLGRIAECPAAVLAYFEENAEGLPRRKLANTFWEPPCPGHDAVVAWFYSAEVAKIPFEAYGYVLTAAE